jgi:hypothetical protein
MGGFLISRRRAALAFASLAAAGGIGSWAARAQAASPTVADIVWQPGQALARAR